MFSFSFTDSVAMSILWKFSTNSRGFCPFDLLYHPITPLPHSHSSLFQPPKQLASFGEVGDSSVLDEEKRSVVLLEGEKAFVIEEEKKEGNWKLEKEEKQEKEMEDEENGEKEMVEEEEEEERVEEEENEKGEEEEEDRNGRRVHSSIEQGDSETRAKERVEGSELFDPWIFDKVIFFFSISLKAMLCIFLNI